MLRALEIEAAPAVMPLMEAVCLIRGHQDARDRPIGFVRRKSKWRRHLAAQRDDGRLWQVAVLFHLRDAFRSGDIWLRNSRRYADLKEALVPTEIVATTPALAVSREPEHWQADRMSRMQAGLRRLADAARMDLLPGNGIKDGILRTDRIAPDPPADADELILDLYRRLPEVRITDILLEVDQALGFTDAFTHLRTGAPCKDRIGLLNVLLAEGINLGLNKMAEASNTHEYWEERPAHRTPGRDPRPLQRRPALPDGRSQSAGRGRHLLEYSAAGRGRATAKTRWAAGRARVPGAHLTPRMGSHPADR